MLKQEALLRRGLRERGFRDERIDVAVNHDRGTCWLNGKEFGVIYPDSFFEHTKHLMKFPKVYSFYFNGEMHETGGRPRMLAPFAAQRRSRVVASSVGRYSFMKSRFNGLYFANLAMSEFGLCPHHADWPGDVMWTYRFVECAMVGTIPVVFRETPLDEQFTRGFHFLWDDEVSTRHPDAVQVSEWSKSNRSLAESRFRLPINLSL